MGKLYRKTGISAMILTLIYLVGIVMNLSMLDTSGIEDPVALVAFMGEHEALMYIWITLLYVVFGIVLVYFSLGIYDVLKKRAMSGARLALIFGLIWSVLVIASGMVHNVGMQMALELYESSPLEAGEFFRVINGIHIGLGGGNEIPGGIWTILISLAAVKSGYFKRWISLLGIVVGIAGVLTIVPVFFDIVVTIFALGQMIWWVALGVSLLKMPESVTIQLEVSND